MKSNKKKAQRKKYTINFVNFGHDDIKFVGSDDLVFGGQGGAKLQLRGIDRGSVARAFADLIETGEATFVRILGL